MKKITILIPIFNEVNTLKTILEKVEETDFCGLEKEIIMIDDFSTDGTREILAELKDQYKIFYHEKNKGKGKGGCCRNGGRPYRAYRRKTA